jgi:dihydropteroate synthase
VTAPEHIVFITGRLARARLEKVAAGLPDTFRWSIADAGVKVAALMTEEIIRRRVDLPEGATKVVLPGRCRADTGKLAAHFNLPVERGPDEVVDLPAWLGLAARKVDLSRHDLRIFSEIVDASKMTVDQILAKGLDLAGRGADVIDLGGLPDTSFPHLEDCVRALKGAGLTVSVDSFSRDELARGAGAGADYLLSLNEESLDLAFETDAVPILVPLRPDDLPSLDRAIDRMLKAGRPFIADPILEPIHHGFVDSIARYRETRVRWPDIDMMMGTGNLTELTEADSLGVTALLVGMCSELAIRNTLIVQVSNHTRRTVEEHDAARRVMYAARADAALPKGYGRALLALHDKRPFVQTSEEVAQAAGEVRDPNYRIAVTEDGIHVYNRDIHRVGTDAMAFFPDLDVASDGAHAFYLGAELAKAETAWRLGKRYVQDEPLDWGCAADAEVVDATAFKKAGHTRHSGPDAPPPGTRDARSVKPEADARPPETITAAEARAETTSERPQAAPVKLVCGRLIPADKA